jgi:hypothetical protein
VTEQYVDPKTGETRIRRVPNPENDAVGERRGRGAYVVGPGSFHPNTGRRYVVVSTSVLAPSPDTDEAKPVTAGPAIGTDEQNKIADVIENALVAADIEYRDRVISRGGELKWAVCCPWEHEHSGSAEDKQNMRFNTSSMIILWPDGKIIYACKHAHCEHRKWHENTDHNPDEYLRDYIEDEIGRQLVFNELKFTGQFQLQTLRQVTTSPVPAPVVSVHDTNEKETIPPFDPTCVTGFFKRFVDTICEGTTIPPQFVYLALRVYVGAYLSSNLKMSGVDTDSCIYGVSLGATGTSKGLSWRRGVEKMGVLPVMEGVRVIHSADSGAGLRDVFFAASTPVIMFIDEMASLGHKANPTKNPEIVDQIVELADTKVVGRTKAKNNKWGGSKSTEARLGFYGCAQAGDVFREAFAGRKKQGIDERFDFEYSDQIVPGELPDIPISVYAELADEFVKLMSETRLKETLTMAPAASAALLDYWNSLPTETKYKVRLLKNLRRDCYLQAWSRGVLVVEIEDVACVTRHFGRQLVIRRLMLGNDAPNKVGLYISKLKESVEKMQRRCNDGVPVKMVAKSLRDFQTETLAYKENELDTFRKAWDAFCKGYLVPVLVKAANGQLYTKLAPMPQEHEVWNWDGVHQGDWRSV